MKPLLETLCLIFGFTGCLVLLAGCLLVAYYLLAAHRPHPAAAETGLGEGDAPSQDRLPDGWPVRLLVVLLGGTLVVAACFRWAGLALTPRRPSAAQLAARVDPHELLSVNLFPWD